LVIAHRLSTIRNADRILVLEGGEVVEAGSHETLLARNGRYVALVHTQQATSRPSEKSLPATGDAALTQGLPV
jgi:ABC-type transport system involved in cytochrome bd biosynthesis fused ATPase/permease subunit